MQRNIYLIPGFLLTLLLNILVFTPSAKSAEQLELQIDGTLLPVSIEELTKILKGIALLDNRKGTYFDGVVGEYEPYFE